MSAAEQPQRLRPGRSITVRDIDQIAGPASPHFALQLRERIGRLIRGLPHADPAWIAGRRRMAELKLLAETGEVRGEPPAPDLPPLPTLALPASLSTSPRGLPRTL
jgi:hypothetical protein